MSSYGIEVSLKPSQLQQGLGTSFSLCKTPREAYENSLAFFNTLFLNHFWFFACQDRFAELLASAAHSAILM
eukprot:12921073-Prorocentrum_lima.AAC.1